MSIRHTQYAQAIDEGVLAFFDETYGEQVRVVEVREDGDRFSAELCGGTHCSATGEIGLVYIVGESSIGAGLRRIEALTGRGAEEHLERQMAVLQAASRRLATTPSELEVRLAAFQQEMEAQRRRAEALEREAARRVAEGLLSRAEQVDGVAVVAARVSASRADALREMGDLIRDRLGSAVVVLGAVVDERPIFMAMVTSDLVERGVHAGEIARQIAAVTGGGGGGRPNLAQAGGRDPSRLDDALKMVSDLVRASLGPHQ